MPEAKLNCWEFMRCGRGPDKRQPGQSPCPAALEERLNKIHGGQNSGRSCWVVAGTFCGGTAQGTFAQKFLACKRCDFYNKVQNEEGSDFVKPHSLLAHLKDSSSRLDITQKKLGILIGGSGLIGGTLMHYFKTKTSDEFEVLSPNSKKMSLREPGDIKQYFEKYKPDFIINSAIAAIDSGPQLAYEINYRGSILLAEMAMTLRVPYIHFSSAATLPLGEDITEDQMQPLTPSLSNYAKSKLMAEHTLKHLHETRGLDFTIIRLAVVYGKHDHKIQGFHRLLFSIANQAMPFMMTRKEVYHSYSNTKKLAPFVHHILDRRAEFSGQTYHFVDQEPVQLSRLILTIKSRLGLNTPREIYIPYPLSHSGKQFLKWLVRRLSRIGVEIKLPAELMFMKNFYKTQTLSTEKLKKSSYKDPNADKTIYTELDEMIEYYLTRWQHFNLLADHKPALKHQEHLSVEDFIASPDKLLESIHHGRSNISDQDDMTKKKIIRS